MNREKESIDKVRKRAILLGHDGDKVKLVSSTVH